MTDTDRDPRPRRFPLGAIVIIALIGGALLLFTSGDMSWNPLAGGQSHADPMELSGRWLGMRLTAANTPTAQSLAVAPDASGVVIAELGPATRAQLAGLMPGDVIVDVDGTGVASLTELYTLTTELDVHRALPLAVMRRGQRLSVVLSAPPGAVAGSVAGVMPAGIPTGIPAAPAFPTAPAMGAAPTAPMYYCPSERLYWNQTQVGPGFTCPRCGGGLAR